MSYGEAIELTRLYINIHGKPIPPVPVSLMLRILIVTGIAQQHKQWLVQTPGLAVTTRAITAGLMASAP